MTESREGIAVAAGGRVEAQACHACDLGKGQTAVDLQGEHLPLGLREVRNRSGEFFIRDWRSTYVRRVVTVLGGEFFQGAAMHVATSPLPTDGMAKACEQVGLKVIDFVESVSVGSEFHKEILHDVLGLCR